MRYIYRCHRDIAMYFLQGCVFPADRCVHVSQYMSLNSPQRRSDTITCAFYWYCDFHTFLYYASRELNVIDSGTVKLKSYPGLPALDCFIQTWYHVMFIPVDDSSLSVIVPAGNNRIALFNKSKFHQRMHACFVHTG